MSKGSVHSFTLISHSFDAEVQVLSSLGPELAKAGVKMAGSFFFAVDRQVVVYLAHLSYTVPYLTPMSNV